MGINTKHSEKNHTKYIIILLFVKYTIYAFGLGKFLLGKEETILTIDVWCN